MPLDDYTPGPHFPKEYTEHEVFGMLKDIERYYERWSDAAIGFIPKGYDPKGIMNIDVYIVSSIGGTIDSIRMLLEKGRINDAFALVRKYFDEVVFDIYQSVKREDYDHEDLNNLLHVDEELQSWKDSVIRIKKIDVLLNYLKKAKLTEDLMRFFNFEKDGWFGKMRDYLDANMHMCSYIHLLKNDNSIFNQYRVKYLDRINLYVKNLFLLHFVATITVNGQYMMASDCRDYMDCGETPPKGSELWIALWAQEAFDKFIKPHEKLAENVRSSCYLEIE